jgi:hypothetical protein
MTCDEGDAVVVRSYFPPDRIPADPTGKWACETLTVGGQLVGIRKFEVLTATGEHAPETEPPKTTTPTPDGGVGVDAAPSD